MTAAIHPRHDSEVIATTSQRPIKIRMRCLIDLQDLTARNDNFIIPHTIASPAIPSTEEAYAASEN
ncbi:hypothetical protein AC579_2200 [Pseudocercospora musae]|uniref:Uncharacterized protein n=1 Tax=Pseudocercospora musae TaxID=113226 RepID=A0A139IKQ6_9PEZI|nr:hypothetical protein AC579_2200 [Pseudocercospora musae]